MVVAVVVLAVLAVGLAAVAVRQHAELVDLRARVRLPGPSGSSDTDHDAIVIVIHNHHDVAAGRTRLARGLSAVSPNLVRNLVHRETLREVRAQLEEQGIDADVRIRRVVARDPSE